MNQDENAPQGAQDGAGIDLLAGRRDKRNPDGTWAEGNLAAFKTGERSRGLLDVPALAEAHREMVNAIEADMGADLSTLKRGAVREAARLMLIVDSLGNDLLTRGVLTAKGKNRAALTAYAMTLDRLQKLMGTMALIGDRGRSRPRLTDSWPASTSTRGTAHEHRGPATEAGHPGRLRQRRVHVEQAGGRGWEPIRLHPFQRDFLRELIDTYDAEGFRRFRRALAGWPKKFGKSSFGGLVGVWHLIFDDTETSRDVRSLAGDMDQSRITLQMGQSIIKNSPRLAALVGVRLFLNRNETVYEAENGQVHRWTAMASDSPTSHGLNPSLVIVDEGWQLANYELLEAVSLGPQRRHPLQMWTTYAGMKAQMVEGNPLYDLYRAGMAKDDPKLYTLWLTGEAAYTELPTGFIRDGYLDEQRRLLAENRFKRMHMNEWGGADASFLTEEEIARATDTSMPVADSHVEPHVMAVDYGRSHDHTALIVGRPDAETGRTVITNALAIKGIRTAPVALETVEREVLDWVRRYRVERVHIDPFQMLGSAERIAKELKWPILDSVYAEEHPWHTGIVLQPIGPSYLNRLTMGMLGAFRSGLVRLPAGLQELIDQLGAVVARETYYGVRVDSGAGAGVRGHDDLVLATGMCLLDIERRRGLRPIRFAEVYLPHLHI